MSIKEFDIPTTVKNKELVQKRREQILQAAIKLFSQKGFFKTTLKELAEEAGLSHGNIYDYVGSKEDILFLIHDHLAGIAMNALIQCQQNIKDPLEKLQRMISAEFNTMSQWPDALLLIYREAHILSKKYLKNLLEKERKHLTRFESVIEECIENNIIRDCNTRLVSNLIKSMVDTWVLKRWDLRGAVNENNVANEITNVILYGILKEHTKINEHEKANSLNGKNILFVGFGTIYGEAIISYLESKGANIVYCSYKDYDLYETFGRKAQNISCYNINNYNSLSADLIDKVQNDFGFIDIYIHELGVGNTNHVNRDFDKEGLEDTLRSIFSDAQSFARNYIQLFLSNSPFEKIVYIAPWGWDKYIDNLTYQITKSGAIALTETISEHLASHNVNINCIIPGYIKSEQPLNYEKNKYQILHDNISSNYIGDISDVLETLNFLLASYSRYISGEVIHVTGGLSS